MACLHSAPLLYRYVNLQGTPLLVEHAVFSTSAVAKECISSTTSHAALFCMSFLSCMPALCQYALLCICSSGVCWTDMCFWKRHALPMCKAAKCCCQRMHSCYMLAFWQSSPVHLQLRAVLYPAAGLNATTGQPSDCSTSGRVLIRAEQGSDYGLSAWSPGSQRQETDRASLPKDLALAAGR